MLFFNFIIITLFLSYYFYQRGNNIPTTHLFNQLNQESIKKMFYSIERSLDSKKTAKISKNDCIEIKKLRNLLLMFEFNLPIRSFHTSRKLRLNIEFLLIELDNPVIWPLRKDNLILNRLNAGKYKLKHKNTSRYECELFSQKYQKDLKKKTEKIRKEYYQLLKLLVNNWVFSF